MRKSSHIFFRLRISWERALISLHFLFPHPNIPIGVYLEPAKCQSPQAFSIEKIFHLKILEHAHVHNLSSSLLFLFNKTYAVAVTEEEATKAREWVQYFPQLYHEELWLLSWMAEGRVSLPATEGPRAAWHPEMAPTWQPHSLGSSHGPYFLAKGSRQTQNWWNPIPQPSLGSRPSFTLPVTGCLSGPILTWTKFQWGTENGMTYLKSLHQGSQVQRQVPKNPVGVWSLSPRRSLWGQVLRAMYFLLKILP